MDIVYKIKFFSDWHCGSGLSSGVDQDLLVIKDRDGLPFVPGKTMKGLIGEALKDIKAWDERYVDLNPDVVLGKEPSKEPPGDQVEQGCAFFKNAKLDKELKEHIVEYRLQNYLYRSVASTAIGEDGVAKDHSLRKMQVAVPCELMGEILDIPEKYDALFRDALRYVKRLGQNRNRGLGRCSIEIISPAIEEI